jgi:hypothetical protein
LHIKNVYKNSREYKYNGRPNGAAYRGSGGGLINNSCAYGPIINPRGGGNYNRRRIMGPGIVLMGAAAFFAAEKMGGPLFYIRIQLHVLNSNYF